MAVWHAKCGAGISLQFMLTSPFHVPFTKNQTIQTHHGEVLRGWFSRYSDQGTKSTAGHSELYNHQGQVFCAHNKRLQTLCVTHSLLSPLRKTLSPLPLR